MDDSEFDIYDDLDDFENKEKQAEKVMCCISLILNV